MGTFALFITTIVVQLFFVAAPVSANLRHNSNTDQDFQILSNPNRYTPDWESLDKRPIPQWYDQAKFGIFIHWGVFSVPSFGEWFWYNWITGEPSYDNFMKKNYPFGFTYADFAPQFRAEFFDPFRWAEIFQSSGAKYVVLTSKHHEGFTLWPSRYSWNWNAFDVGPKRDLVGDLAHAIRSNTTLRFGLYHSLYEWFHPLYLRDKANNFATNDFVTSKTMPELYELVTAYKPEVIWSDGDWETDDIYWGSTKFLSWLYNDSPVSETVVVNDRWGYNVQCKHGDFVNCEDRFNPGVLKERKWENAMTIDRVAWAFRRNAKLEDFLSIEELIETLVTTVSCGGNLLMNVGPTADGIIRPIFEERLRDIGRWLEVNGQAIFDTQPWTNQNDTLNQYTWFTSKKESNLDVVYGITLKWPENEVLTIGAPLRLTSKSTVELLGFDSPLKWTYEIDRIAVVFPKRSAVNGNWAWTVKFTL